MHALATEIRDRLGPWEAAECPLISIVVVSHDGAEHLRRLLAGLSDRTDYPRLELIVVDNGSGDESLELLRSAATPFPLSIVANQHNESFSDANNQGAALARGDLLLFLNNDVEPFEAGWLRELVACRRAFGAGAVGATLLFPHDDGDRFPHGFAVQHRGLRFRDEDGTLGPVLHQWEADPLDARLGEDVESPAVVAACLLVDAALFERVGGFTHGYVYGSEDIDFCLKLRAAGEVVICSGRSLAIHRPGSTRRAVAFERARERKLRNHRMLLERWGPRLRREHDRDVLAGGGMWVQEGREHAVASSREQVEALAICVKASDAPSVADDTLEQLRAVAAGRGHRCIVLRGADVDDLRGLECDVALHLRGRRRYLPAAGQFNALWAPRSCDRLSGAECDLYDLTLSGDGAQAIRLGAASATPMAVVPDEAVLDVVLAAAIEGGGPGGIGRRPAGRRSPASAPTAT